MSERLRLAGRVVLVTVLILGLAALFYANVPESTREVVGTIAAFGADSSDAGIWHYAVVQLDGGRSVRAHVTGIGSLKRGDRVTLLEYTGHLLRWKTYRIVQRIGAAK